MMSSIILVSVTGPMLPGTESLGMHHIIDHNFGSPNHALMFQSDIQYLVSAMALGDLPVLYSERVKLAHSQWG